jgi:hypothetical protein
MPITIGGITRKVPGAYGIIEFINEGGVIQPSFNNILFIGAAKKGLPYNASGKNGAEIIKAFTSTADAENYYGISDLTKAYGYAKAGGAGVAYFINASPLTSASATLKDTASTPVATMTVTPKDKFYGAAGNDISIAVGVATNDVTVTIIPPKLTKFLTANAASGAISVGLDNVAGLRTGQTILLNDIAAAAPESLVIAGINTDTNVVTFTTALSAAHTTANYARIFVEDTDNQEVKTFDKTSATFEDEVLAWINEGQILNATRSAAQTGELATAVTKVYLQNVTGATKGTSPDPTETASGDYDLCASALPKLIEKFSDFTGVRLRLFCLLNGNAAVHAVYKALTVTLRSVPNNVPIQLLTGCALGDIDKTASDSDHPINRAKALNTDDVILAGMGLDGYAAYLSLAPQVAGIMSANGVGRNLTNDIISAVTVEKHFGKYNQESETQSYLEAGVLIVKSGKNGSQIVQGVNTYQWHNSSFNSSDKKTYLIRYRQIMDYISEGYQTAQEVGVGSDNYTPDMARVIGLDYLSQFMGVLIDEYGIDKAYREGTAVFTVPRWHMTGTTDFVGIISRVDIKNL